VDRIGEMFRPQELGDPLVGTVVDQNRAEQRQLRLDYSRWDAKRGGSAFSLGRAQPRDRGFGRFDGHRSTLRQDVRIGFRVRVVNWAKNGDAVTSA
jgi:hypothetical protein